MQPARAGEFGVPRLHISKLNALDDAGQPALRDISLSIRGGEIVGVAGVSGNGQRQLVEVLAGQRDAESGEIVVDGELYHATREEMRERKVSCLPEEPLKNACVARMSVAENLAFRDFDRAPVRGRRLVAEAKRLSRAGEPQDRPIQDQDPRAGYADRRPLRRQCAARRAGARAGRRGRYPDRRQSVLRSRLRGGGADPRRDHGSAQPRRCGAAGERGPRRASWSSPTASLSSSTASSSTRRRQPTPISPRSAATWRDIETMTRKPDAWCDCAERPRLA